MGPELEAAWTRRVCRCRGRRKDVSEAPEEPLEEVDGHVEEDSASRGGVEGSVPVKTSQPHLELPEEEFEAAGEADPHPVSDGALEDLQGEGEGMGI